MKGKKEKRKKKKSINYYDILLHVHFDYFTSKLNNLKIYKFSINFNYI